MAVAHLLDAGIEPQSILPRMEVGEVRTVRRMLDRNFNSPPTSSAGRLFDAVASLAGARDRVSFEGQAAMQLEWLAGESVDGQAYPWVLAPNPSAAVEIDTRPMFRAIVDDLGRGVEPATVARRFHNTMAALIADLCSRLRAESGIDKAVLSGGVFMNAILAMDAEAALRRMEFKTYRHRRVPPNDGGLSLGQAAVAAAQWPETKL
jgi:hydrogenase maturation protein HypF